MPLIPLDYFVFNQTYFAASLSIFCTTIAYGWTSPMLPKLLGTDGPIHLTSSQGSGLVVAMLAGGVCSPLPIAYFMDKYILLR